MGRSHITNELLCLLAHVRTKEEGSEFYIKHEDIVADKCLMKEVFENKSMTEECYNEELESVCLPKTASFQQCWRDELVPLELCKELSSLHCNLSMDQITWPAIPSLCKCGGLFGGLPLNEFQKPEQPDVLPCGLIFSRSLMS